jgi:hypothetical protein
MPGSMHALAATDTDGGRSERLDRIRNAIFSPNWSAFYVRKSVCSLDGARSSDSVNESAWEYTRHA